MPHPPVVIEMQVREEDDVDVVRRHAGFGERRGKKPADQRGS
jgi:hypothetical protein